MAVAAPNRICPTCSLATADDVCPHDGTPTCVKDGDTSVERLRPPEEPLPPAEMPAAGPDRICPACSLATEHKICPHDGTPTYIKVVDAPGLRPGLVIGDRYRIVSRVGQGGFGAVYRAVHVATHNDIAVKVLRREMATDTSQVQRFHAEAKASCLLQGAHTVRVYDFGQIDDGSLYMAMEFLRGRPLGTVLRVTPALPPARVVHILGQVLTSLAEAHAHGIVHRDLKPGNIFIVDMFGETDYVKVIDFGVAKFTGELEKSLTRTGLAIGTPRYMSPEQARGHKVDGRSDIYSVGIMAYRMLAGKLPFDAENSAETILMQIGKAPPPLAEVASQPLPQALIEAVEKALAKRPEDRFQTADEMRRALEESLADRRMVGPPPKKTAPAEPAEKITEEVVSPSFRPSAGSSPVGSPPVARASSPVEGSAGFTGREARALGGEPAFHRRGRLRHKRTGAGPEPERKRSRIIVIAALVAIAGLGLAAVLTHPLWSSEHAKPIHPRVATPAPARPAPVPAPSTAVTSAPVPPAAAKPSPALATAAVTTRPEHQHKRRLAAPHPAEAARRENEHRPAARHQKAPKQEPPHAFTRFN